MLRSREDDDVMRGAGEAAAERDVLRNGDAEGLVTLRIALAEQLPCGVGIQLAIEGGGETGPLPDRFFFCLPAILGMELGNVFSTVLTLSLYMGAISSESFRAALRSIGAEQRDACVALGLPARVSVPYVILPQTVLRAVPTLLSNCVTLFKESALVSAVGMADLMYQGQMIADSTARPIEILTATALIYFIIAFSVTRIVSFYERGDLARMRL